MTVVVQHEYHCVGEPCNIDYSQNRLGLGEIDCANLGGGDQRRRKRRRLARRQLRADQNSDRPVAATNAPRPETILALPAHETTPPLEENLRRPVALHV